MKFQFILSLFITISNGFQISFLTKEIISKYSIITIKSLLEEREISYEDCAQQEDYINKLFELQDLSVKIRRSNSNLNLNVTNTNQNKKNIPPISYQVISNLLLK